MDDRQQTLQALTPTLYPSLNRAERYFADRNYEVMMRKLRARRPARRGDTPMGCAQVAYSYAWRTTVLPVGLMGAIGLISLSSGSHQPFSLILGIALLAAAVGGVLRLRPRVGAANAFFRSQFDGRRR